MIRISKLADYAVVILDVMAEQPEEVMSASVLSQKTKLPEPTISKVLKLLAKAHIVTSLRGMNGGYQISHMPDSLSIETVIAAIDGPIAITACSDGNVPDCSLIETCTVRGRWDGVNTAIRSALSSVTLADMMEPRIEKGKKRYGSH